ncbi:MAG: dTDP-glucose 4,6-dehydratase [Candidatus Omnitrophica bacterium]|nr:dTDP-glucose 4,6-dehydratase [Candidatus Omnitrophota bacterium]
MKTVLVTGGAGFIGSNFIRHILNNYPDYRIINLDKLAYSGNLNNLKDIQQSPSYKFIKGDICDKRTVESAIKRSDLVVNFAAQTHVDRSIKASAEFVRTNIEGIRVLLDAARKFKIKRFMQISTDEVYGDIKRGLSDENDILLPNSPYAASKAAADLLVHSYYMTYKIPIIITRSSNNFGPYQYPEKVMPLFITNAVENKPLPLYGDGKNIRDWIYVLDNCSAIDLALHKGRPGEIYNIGGNNLLRNIRIADKIVDFMSRDKKLISFVKDRPGHDRRYALNSNKMKKLGWDPEYNFKKALRSTIEWYMANEWWWKPLKRKAKIINW